MAEINKTNNSKFSPKKRKWVKPGQPDIELYPNQTAFTVNKMNEQNYEAAGIPFGMHSVEATYYASRNLSNSGFKLFMYFVMNAHNFQRALSPKHVQETMGLSKQSFFNARQELIEEGFLHFKEKDDKTLFFNVYEFFECPWDNKSWQYYEEDYEEKRKLS